MAYLYPCASLGIKKKSRFFVFFFLLFFKALCKFNSFFSGIIDFANHSDKPESFLENLFKKKSIVRVGGWGFFVPDLTKKHRDFFVKEYTLKEEFRADNELCIRAEQLKKDGRIVVGIHVRRGDYKTWRGGQFYFEDDVYIAAMNRMLAFLGDKAFFIVFSNESKLNLPSELKNRCVFSSEAWYIDQYVMSECDYLIGPPSTFTAWASYIGRAQYVHLSKGHDFSLESFSKCFG